MVWTDGGIHIAILYDCIRYVMVYGIEVAKVRRRIKISSVWTRHTLVLNGRAIALLECMSSTNEECESVSYGVMKIRK